MNRPLIRPGRHLSQPLVHAPHAALLIDFDNVTLGVQKDLTKELRTLLNSDIIKGKVAVQRAYADWRRYPQYIVPLSESSIDLIFAPAFGSSKKNATDIRLAIDAIELVFTRPEIGTFILLSGDSDFSTMVIKLKEYGKYVIGVGIRESASDLPIQNCDEYYSYNDLAGLTKEGDVPSIQRDPWVLAAEAASQMSRNGDVMRSDRLKQVMQQIDPNFDERTAGFNRFTKFVLEAAQKGVVLATKLENGQYEVAPVPAASTGAVAPAPRREETEPTREARDGREEASRRGRPRRGRGRERGFRERSEETRETATTAEMPVVQPRSDGALTLAQTFQLMTQALTELRPPVGQEALRLRMVAMHGRDDALLDPARFSKLLRQANDAEVADVRKLGEDEYEISPHRLGGMPGPAATGSPPPAASGAEQTRPELVVANADVPEPMAETASRDAAPRDAVPRDNAPRGSAPRDSAQRLGLRFRRGSRAPMRAGEVPLIGVVRVHEPPASTTESFPELAGLAPMDAAEPVETFPILDEQAHESAAGAAAEPTTEVARKPSRPRRKRASTAAVKAAPAEVVSEPAPGGEAEPATRPKRPRARPRKKAE